MPSGSSIASVWRRWSPASWHSAAFADSPPRWRSRWPEAIGDLWARGEMPIAAEHLASEVVVQALKGGCVSREAADRFSSPAASPASEHEWGFLCTLVALQERGWRIHYLGADLPVDQVAEAAWKLKPRAIALSGSDPAIVRANLPALAALPAKLPPDTLAAIGGAGVEPHAGRLRNYGYRMGPQALHVWLDGSRGPIEPLGRVYPRRLP